MEKRVDGGRLKRRVPRRRLLAATVATLAMAVAAVPARAVDRQFFGVVPQGAIAAGEWGQLAQVAGTVRVPFYWFQMEATEGEPDFAVTDEIVGAAADHGIAVLPFVYGTPAWLAADPAHPPLGSAARRDWTRFLQRLVGRYGPRGSFWRDRRQRMPIHRWQIWNEPNFRIFWRPRPAPVAYAGLLRISARAIRHADRRARIVAAGVAPVEAGMLPWAFLRKMYRAPGVRRDFDVAAVHPYATSLISLEYQLALIRGVMKRAGDGRKPLQVTEIGVASDSPLPTLFDKGLAGQARFLDGAYSLLAARRRHWHLAGIDWFTWRDGTQADPNCWFCEYAGLLDSAGRAKPAWRALRQIERQPRLWGP